MGFCVMWRLKNLRNIFSFAHVQAERNIAAVVVAVVQITN